MPGIRATDHLGPNAAHLIACFTCGAIHNPPLTNRKASDARHQARHDGWRAHSSPRRRRRQPDQCPICRNRRRGNH